MEAKLPVVELNKAEAVRQRQEKQEAARQKAGEKFRKQGNAVFDANQNPKYAACPINARKPADEDLSQLLSGTTTVDPRVLRNAMDKLSLIEEDLAKMSEADQPKKLITQLLPYQKQVLKWMLEHESPEIKNQLMLYNSGRNRIMDISILSQTSLSRTNRIWRLVGLLLMILDWERQFKLCH